MARTVTSINRTSPRLRQLSPGLRSALMRFQNTLLDPDCHPLRRSRAKDALVRKLLRLEGSLPPATNWRIHRNLPLPEGTP